MPSISIDQSTGEVPLNGGRIPAEVVIETDEEASKQALDRRIVFCVDTSTSMKRYANADQFEDLPDDIDSVDDIESTDGLSLDGFDTDTKLDKVREGILDALDQLDPEDSVGLVAFDSDSKTVVPMKRWSEHDQSDVEAEIETLSGGGTTDIAAGISQSRSELSESSEAGATRRIILLTDGRDTGDFDDIVEELNEDGIKMIAAGVGDGYREDVVETLGGAGDFTHLEDEDIASFFRDRVSDAGSIVATDPELIVETRDSFMLDREVFTTTPKVKHAAVNSDGDRTTVELPELSSEQMQSVRMELLVTPSTAPMSTDIATVELHMNGRSVDTETVSVDYVEEVDDDQRNDKVAVGYKRSKARAHALDDDYETAKELASEIEDELGDKVAADEIRSDVEEIDTGGTKEKVEVGQKERLDED
jgi:Ca-activated chloride channel family protein